jgi:hypothetical protein
MSATGLKLPSGSVAIRMRVFDTPQQELTDALAPPWPRWVRRLYEIQALQSSHVDVLEGRVPVSAALAALRVHLFHRLGMLVFVCAHLEELGWDIELSGADLVAYKVTAPGMAREALDADKLNGYLMALSDVDDRGQVRLYAAGELGEERDV